MKRKRELGLFDREMVKHFSYHRKLVRLCCALAAICDDAKLFNRYAPSGLRNKRNNAQIRWALEDRIRELLRENRDYPRKASQ